MEFILLLVPVQPTLLSLFNVQIKLGGKSQFILLSMNTQLSKISDRNFLYIHNQTYQIPCKVHPITQDLDPISSSSLENLTTLTIDPLSYLHFQTLLLHSFHQQSSKFKSSIQSLKKESSLGTPPLVFPPLSLQLPLTLLAMHCLLNTEMLVFLKVDSLLSSLNTSCSFCKLSSYPWLLYPLIY